MQFIDILCAIAHTKAAYCATLLAPFARGDIVYMTEIIRFETKNYGHISQRIILRGDEMVKY